MCNYFKRILALCLSALLLIGCFAGCGNENSQEETTEPVPTQSPEEAAVLKVLVLGHSLAVDSGHMLNLVANAEGYSELRLATLYYSGCPLNKHVQFLTNDSREYQLFVSSTATPNVPPEVMNEVTMREAIKFDYWDIIIMQGGVFELIEDATFQNGDIQTIQKFVNEHKLNPTAVFGWHMPWATPVDDDLRNSYPLQPNSYITNYEKLGHNRSNYYNGIVKCVSNHIVTDETFKYLIPSGTAMENALSSYMTEKDLHRDYAHASDLGRVIAAYTWYCVLTGVESLSQIKLNAIPKAFFKSIVATEDYVLTDSEKALILESVNNALKNPLQMTQSQYTEAPADYVAK